MFCRNAIPARYDVVKHNKTTVALEKTYSKVLFEMGVTEPDRFYESAQTEADTYTGRGTVKIVTLPGPNGERMVIRRYHRGGTIQKIISNLYFGASRPFQELWLTDQALERGIATVQIVAACHTDVFWGFHRGYLVSKEIKNGKDLMTYLEGLPRPLSAEKLFEKRNVIVAVAGAIRKMHDAGIFHADLNLKNIIIQIDEAAGIRSYLIDFDKSVIKQHLRERRRRQNLMRLNRSVEKFKRQGLCLTRTDSLRFIRAYYHEEAGDYGVILRDLNRQFGRHIYIRRLGAKIGSLFVPRHFVTHR